MLLQAFVMPITPPPIRGFPPGTVENPIFPAMEDILELMMSEAWFMNTTVIAADPLAKPSNALFHQLWMVLSEYS